MVCTDYAAGGGDGPEGYYVRPIPSNCRAQHLGGWRPTFRVVRNLLPCFLIFIEGENLAVRKRGKFNVDHHFAFLTMILKR